MVVKMFSTTKMDIKKRENNWREEYIDWDERTKKKSREWQLKLKWNAGTQESWYICLVVKLSFRARNCDWQKATCGLQTINNIMDVQMRTPKDVLDLGWMEGRTSSSDKSKAKKSTKKRSEMKPEILNQW